MIKLLISERNIILFVLIFYFSEAFCISSGNLNVKDFGARGDGKTDDTYAIRKAVGKLSGGVLEFPGGTYRITETIDIVLSKNGTIGITGNKGNATIIMEGRGPAFRFTGTHNGTASPESVKEITWQKERMPIVEGIEITGRNPEAEGLEFRHTIMPVLHSLLIREVHNGIRIASRNRNVLIDACHIYNCSGAGILLDSVNLHQIIISDCHISYCKQAGIKASGSEIRNFQITGNDIEYNYDPANPGSADIFIDCSQRGSVREGTISGNTIQAMPSPGGANIRFSGTDKNDRQIGLWSITGNHISNQTVNIHLDRTKGITISGNTFIRGYDCHIVLNNSSNIIITSNVFDHNNDYFPENIIAPGGIHVKGSGNIIFSDNILDGVDYGSAEKGGAFTIENSGETIINNCQIINPRFRGIYLINSNNVRISQCMIYESAHISNMLTGIELNGSCSGTLVKDNSISCGKNGEILNHSSDAIIDRNVSIIKKPE